MSRYGERMNPRPAAGLLAWGVALLGAAFLVPVLAPALVEYPEDMRAWGTVAAVLAVVGLACLAAGVFRAGRHADRAAGVQPVERGPGPREARDDRA